MPRDYYQILGVDRKAEPAAIKKAYRKLAKKLHPDVNKTPEASSQFNELQEAFDAISDPDKRSRYDQFGHAGLQGDPDPFAGSRTYTTPGGFSFNAEGMGQGFSLDDVFSQFFGGGGPGSSGPAGPFGPGPGQARPQAQQAAHQKPADQHHTVGVPFETAMSGGSIGLKLTGAGGSQTIDVKIPKGIGDGTQMRLRGKGANGGDLILTVRIEAHAYFTRRGLDLTLDVPISLEEALFGATVEVPTRSGRADLKIPAGTSGGTKLRLRGAGVENAKAERGDLYAIIRIDIPEDLAEEDLAALEQLKGKLPDPRRRVEW
jgi:curved DNA-binding protein